MLKKSFNILKNNMIFIQPVLIWQAVFFIVMYVSAERIQLPPVRLLMYFSIVMLFILCLAGWFHINKLAVLGYDEKDDENKITEKALENFKKFFEGVGENCTKIICSSLLLAALYIAAFIGIFQAGLNYFGMPEFIKELAQTAPFGNSEQLAAYFSKISETDALIFAKWTILINSVLCILNFFALLYFAAANFENKNFIISFFKAVKLFISNFFSSVYIMLYAFMIFLAVNFAINQAALIFGVNAFIFSLFVILNTIYFNYYVLLVFCFYYDKTKKAEDNCSSRGDSVGENEAGAESGAEV